MIAVNLPFISHIIYADENEDLGYFVVEKVWKNDTDKDGNPIVEDGSRNRPTSVMVCLEGSDGTSNDYEITEAENWKRVFRLPLNDEDGNPITYTVYEKEIPNKYVSNATTENKVTINAFETGSKNSTFNVNNKDGFENAPKATVKIDSDLPLSSAIGIDDLPAGFEFTTKRYAYTDPKSEGKKDSIEQLISYTGQLTTDETEGYKDNQIPGTIVLIWENKAEDLVGNKYDVKLTISNIVIRSLANMNKEIAVLNYNQKYLNMQAYVCEFSAPGDSKYKENVVGVKADLKFEIIGIPDDNYAMVMFDDIDIPDYVDHYKDYSSGDNTYFGTEYPFAESVVIKGTPSSDVYINNGKTYLLYDETQRFASQSNNNDSQITNHWTTLEYLAPANKYEFTWAGSDCGTAILMNVSLPDESEYVNKIENVSSLYIVRYFYQTDDGIYKSTPDETSVLKMVTPKSDVKVTDDDKTPKKEGYVLDTREAYTTKWENTTTTDNSATNPAQLDVYFKKEYVVTYNDNVDSEDIFDKQTNPELDYGVNTPGFKGEPNVRPGYDFVGWSETPDGPVIEIPKTVTKNADYWAHWNPRTDTKYTVEYYYEKNGKYPTTPDDSEKREGKTEEKVSVTLDDLIPQKSNYYLNEKMNVEWEGIIKGDGSLVLRIYFKPKYVPEKITHKPPVTGIE